MISSPDIVVTPDGRMDRKNAAVYIGCAEKTLAQWSSQGKGPRCVKRGGRCWYFVRDADAWIAGESPVKPKALALVEG